MEALAVDFRPCTVAGHPFECKKKSKISAWMKKNEVVLVTRTVSFAPDTKQKIVRVTKKQAYQFHEQQGVRTRRTHTQLRFTRALVQKLDAIRPKVEPVYASR